VNVDHHRLSVKANAEPAVEDAESSAQSPAHGEWHNNACGAAQSWDWEAYIDAILSGQRGRGEGDEGTGVRFYAEKEMDVKSAEEYVDQGMIHPPVRPAREHTHTTQAIQHEDVCQVACLSTLWSVSKELDQTRKICN